MILALEQYVRASYSVFNDLDVTLHPISLEKLTYGVVRSNGFTSHG